MMASDALATAEDVWQFWFGGASLKENYNKKWFPKAGKGQRDDMDREITKKFEATLLAFLRDGEERSDWCRSPRGSLCAIVVLDQFSRHIFRSDRHGENQRHSDILALSIANEILRRGWNRGYSESELVFSMMPLRHSPTPARLKNVLEICDARISKQSEQLDLLRKFRKTTFVRLQHLAGKAGPHDGDILEHHPFDADETKMLDNKLIEATHGFLVEQWRRSRSREGSKESCPVDLATTKIEEKLCAYPVVVSLSGGVDSMVIVRILTFLRDNVWGRKSAPSTDRKKRKRMSFSCTDQLPSLDVAAVHIDYANRPESGEEARYVKGWCDAQCVSLRIRRIGEYTRGVTARDEYEKKTRKIRYDLYAQVLSSTQAGGIFFGHHRGDVQENVISNAMKGYGLMSLSGMKRTSVVNGVEIWRPLLQFSKDAIYGFAHAFGVPYFKDTTPAWSTRGKMRNQLIPLLKDMFGVGVVAKLTALAEESDALEGIVSRYLLDPLLSRAGASPFCAWLDCRGYFDRPDFFWKIALLKFFHSFGVPAPSHKARRTLLNFFRHDDTKPEIGNGTFPKDGWPSLKGYNRTLVHRGVLYLFTRGAISSQMSSSKQRKRRSESNAARDDRERNAATPPTTLRLTLEPSKKSVVVRIRNWRVCIERRARVDSTRTEGPLGMRKIVAGDFSFVIPLNVKQRSRWQKRSAVARPQSTASASAKKQDGSLCFDVSFSGRSYGVFEKDVPQGLIRNLPVVVFVRPPELSEENLAALVGEETYISSCTYLGSSKREQKVEGSE
eukprot:g810.t1